jgi:magnesium transporter
VKRPNYLLHPVRPLRRRRRPPPGSSPGLPPPVRDARPSRVTLLAYGPDDFEERQVTEVDSLRDACVRWPVVWVNVDGIEDVGTVQSIGEIFGLHRLALEDVVNVPQRPKVEDYGGYLFVTLQAATGEASAELEQMGIFLGPGFVLTFQEAEGDPLDPVRTRIRNRVGRIRSAGADYLAYAVMDAIVDYYFPVLEHLGDRLAGLEEEILSAPNRHTIAALYAVKRDLTTLRRALWPTRDAMNSLARDPVDAIEGETRVYLRDCYDHVVQCMELLESDRELTSSLTDLYLSSIGQRTNEIMRVLTVISVIFIPLTFIAGVYGMNFDPRVSPWNMPELEWVWGYPFALAVMAALALAMLTYFWRRGWIGRDESKLSGK